MKAVWNGTVVAESDDTVVVEGNHYFPADAVRPEVLRASSHTTTCAWKGQAAYYSLDVDGKVNENAAWYYPEPLPGAEAVAGQVAFWRGVEVRE